MAQLILPNKFGFQPQYPAPLDQSNPFAKDIKLAYSVGRGLQDGAHGLGSVTGTMTYGVGPKGRKVRPADGTSYIAFADNPDYNIVGGVTAFALIEVGGTTVQQHILSKSSGGGGTDTPWAFGLETGGYIFLNRANAGFRVWQSGTALTTGQIVVIAATQGADISVAPKFYVNGILDGVSSTSLYGGSGTGAPNVNTNPVRVGNRADLASQFFGWLYEGDVLNRVLSASEVAALSANLYAIWQAPARRLWAVSAGGGVPLASNSAPTATGAGTLSVKIPITGASAAGVTGQGTLSIALPLAGAGNSAVVGSATLSIAQAMQGSGQASALGAGTLNLAIALNSAALATALGSGTLNGSVALGGSAAAGVAGSGTLKLSLALSSAAIANALGSGNLAVSGSLGGASVASVTGSGSLSQAIPIQGASLAATNASGTLTQLVPITASSSVLASGQGALHLTINMSAAALAQAIDVGNLTLRIALNGASIANAIATGALSGIVRPINPKYSITGYARIRSITAASRVRSVVGM